MLSKLEAHFSSRISLRATCLLLRRQSVYRRAASRDAIIRMLGTIKSWQLQRRTPATIEELSERYNPVLRGWWNYYGSFYPSALTRIFFQVDRKLARWARRKHKRMAGHMRQSAQWLARIARQRPSLFVHWQTLRSGVSMPGAV